MHRLAVITSLACLLTAPAAALADNDAPAPAKSVSGVTSLKTVKLGGKKTVEFRRVSGGGDPPTSDLRAVIYDGQTWWSTDHGPSLRQECGAGHCTTTTVDSESATLTGDVLWIRYELSSTVSLTEGKGKDRVTKSTSIEACKMGAVGSAPSCSFKELDGVAGKITGTDVAYTGDDGTGKPTKQTAHFAF